MKHRITLFAALCSILFLIPALVGAQQQEISWDANPETDIVAYWVHYGTASGIYSHTADVGIATTYTMDDPADGQTYYVAITARNEADLESDYSNEVSFTASEPDPGDDPSDPGDDPGDPGDDPGDPGDAPSDGLTGYWKFDHADGMVITDDSGRAVDGVLEGGTLDTGRIASAVSFDGIDDQIDLTTDDFMLDTQLTIAAWVYLEGDTDTRQVIMQKGEYAHPFILRVENNRLQACIRTDGTHYLSSATELAPETWYHVALTYGNGQQTIYINGAADATASLTGALYVSATTVSTIGASPNGNSPLYGMVDELRIYNRVLGESEISQLHSYTGEVPTVDLLLQDPTLLSRNAEAQLLPQDATEPIEIDISALDTPTLYWVFAYDFLSLGFTMNSSPAYPYSHAFQYRRPGTDAWTNAAAASYLCWVWVTGLAAIGTGEFELRTVCSDDQGNIDYSPTCFIDLI